MPLSTQLGLVVDLFLKSPNIWLLSDIQSVVDEDSRSGRFILTGSQNLGLTEAVTQTLAGRSALLQLLPFGLEEIRKFPNAPAGLLEMLWTGGYPRIYDRSLPADEWLASYTATYVERDVRQVLNVGDLLAFQTFLRLCAGRVGQLLNLSALGADAGVTRSCQRDDGMPAGSLAEKRLQGAPDHDWRRITG